MESNKVELNHPNNFLNVNIKNSNEIQIDLNGEFNYSCFRQFKDIYDIVEQNPELKTMTLDFTNVSNVDMAGLGILLELSEVVGSKLGRKITLLNLPKQIMISLKQLKFDDFFECIES